MDIGGASSAVTSGAQSSIVEEKSLADPGEGLFGTKLRPEGAKKFLAISPPLSQGLVWPGPPPPLIWRSGSATAIRFLQVTILKMDTSQRRWPPWVSATGRCALEIWEVLAAVCFTLLCLCLREKATLMTGPSKLKGSSGGGGGVIYDFFWGGEGHLTCNPLPISDQVCLQFCYSIISRLYTKTPSLIPGYLRTRNSFTPLVNFIYNHS